jgi:hypothetical protein
MSCLIAKEEHCVGTFFHFLAKKNLRHFSPKKVLQKTKRFFIFKVTENNVKLIDTVFLVYGS